MNVFFFKRFQKIYNKRIRQNNALVLRFEERLTLFARNPQSPLLNDHPLKGNKEGLRAFSITGDVRAIYYIVGDTAYFVDIGTHNQVYK